MRGGGEACHGVIISERLSIAEEDEDISFENLCFDRMSP